jgi:2-dehydro-3-deoxygalactonokinase
VTATSLIAVDWGTSSLRAWRMDSAGEILERRRDGLGILKVEDGNFDRAFAQVVGDWIKVSPAAAVLMAGMIGSRQGWLEVPYATCPASVEMVASRLVAVPQTETVRIVPGLSRRAQNEAPDVMRGEETQIFGLDLDTALVILPGTHSKWTSVRRGAIDWFSTFMTGEVYDVLRRHSILGRMMEDGPHDGGVPPGFDAGVGEGLSAASGTLQSLFSTRTRGLFDELSPQDSAGYLSGLLIGSEIREGRAALRARNVEPKDAVLVGAEALTSLYASALAKAGIASSIAGEDCAARGLFRIAQMAHLVAS